MATQTQSHNGLILVLVALAVMAVWLPLVNAPPVSINAHAVERHGEDVLYALNDYQRGECTEVYRSLSRNRVVRLVGTGLVRTGIITTLAGNAVTAYPAPAAYWGIHLAGYERLGREGDCG